MIDSKLVFGAVSVLAACLQLSLYARDVIRGKTRPHTFSWFVWGVPGGIVFAAQFLGGAGAGSWATAVTTILCTAIFVLSFHYGERTITPLDWVSLVVALLAIVWWVVVKDPLLSVILITAIDVIGFVPTARKSIKRPHEETLNSYAIAGGKWILSLFSMSSFTLTVLLYPVAMVLANWGMGGFLLVRRAALARAAK